MRCRLARRLIQELLNGELNVTRQDELTAHLAQCATCRAEEKALRGLRPLLGELPMHEPQPAYWRDLNRAVMSQSIPSSAKSPIAETRRWFRPVVWAGAASMCTFALGLYVGLVMLRGRPSTGAVPIAAAPTPTASAPREVQRADELVLPAPKVRTPRDEAGPVAHAVPTPSSIPSNSLPRPRQGAEPTAGRMFAMYRLAPPTLGTRALAQEEEARAIVEKAVEAHGGQRFSRAKALHVKYTQVSTAVVGIDGTTEMWVQFPDRIKWTKQGSNYTLTSGYDGKKCWRKAKDKAAVEVGAQMIEGAIFSTHIATVTSLKFLTNKGYELSPLGEIKVDDRHAVGVRVHPVQLKDRPDISSFDPDINLYFDKATHLLAKLEIRTLDFFQYPPSQQMVTEEHYFKDYTEANGVKYATRIVLKHDGKLLTVSEVNDYQVLEEAFADDFFAMFPLGLRTPAWHPFDAVGIGLMMSTGIQAQDANAPKGKIAFMRKDGDDTKLFVINADGTDMKAIVTTSKGILRPAWSPDGKQIAYQGFESQLQPPADVYVINADGSGERRITDGNGWNLHPSWSPNGKHILCSGVSFGRGLPHTILRLLNLDGSTVQDIKVDGQGQALFSFWSPDGKRIGYTMVPNTFRNGGTIYLMNADGTGAEQFANSAGFFNTAGPDAWSPDGKTLLTTRKDPSTMTAGLWLTDVTSKSENQLTSFGEAPVWSPDGKWIACSMFENGKGRIHLVSRDGKTKKALTPEIDSCFAPTWTK